MSAAEQLEAETSQAFGSMRVTAKASPEVLGVSGLGAKDEPCGQGFSSLIFRDK